MAMGMTTTATPDLGQVKLRQQDTWSDGDYAQVGVTLQSVGERLAETLDLLPGERVLDVAAGNGNFTLAAARCHARVVSSDYVRPLLERGERRARAEGFDVTFRLADAEDLPFPDGSFDAVGSTFGVMFTPDQAQAAAELARVCRPGGRIGLANWTPDGFIGQLFKSVGRHVPPPPGVASPSLWGTEEHLRELFAGRSRRIELRERDYVFRDHSASAWVDRFRRVYGPVKRAFEALDAAGQVRLEEDLLDLIARFDRGPGTVMRVPATYAEVVVRLS